MPAGWKRGVLAVVAAAAALYGFAALDVTLRARSAYLEGEKYMRWQDHPEEKLAFFESAFQARKKELQAKLGKKALSQDEFNERLELAGFERDEAVKDSSAKYAYVWYRTAVELFTPPESRWVGLSRARMEDAKRLWRSELKARGVALPESVFQ